MSVSKDHLIQFIEKPGLLKEQTIGELKEIIDEFPYFQSAQLLYTYNLHSQANFRFAAYLKTCSIYATDRAVLYRLLQPKSSPAQSLKTAGSADDTDKNFTSLFELSDEKQITNAEFSQLSSAEPNENEIIDFDLLSFDQPDVNYQEGSPKIHERNPEIAVQPETFDTKADEKIDLIEKFIKVNPSILPRIDASNSQNDLLEMKEEVESENDEFITETLSRIYLKQGHYQKAIDSFKRLSLKIPEKSVYFAQQIEEIKKLIN